MAACWQRVFGPYLVRLYEEPIPAQAIHVRGWWRVEIRDATGAVVDASRPGFSFARYVAGDIDSATKEIDSVMTEINLEPPRSAWQECHDGPQ